MMILWAGSVAFAADASSGEASAPPQDAQGALQAPTPPVLSASGAATSGLPSLPLLSALPPDYFATTPHLLGEWPSVRSYLSDLGGDVSLSAVDEAVMNLSGGL
jgi:hypothetical protein